MNINFTIDDDVPLLAFVEGIASVGLTLSNVGDYTFLVHRAETRAEAAVAAHPKVIDLATRRPRTVLPAPVSS